MGNTVDIPVTQTFHPSEIGAYGFRYPDRMNLYACPVEMRDCLVVNYKVSLSDKDLIPVRIPDNVAKAFKFSSNIVWINNESRSPPASEDSSS